MRILEGTFVLPAGSRFAIVASRFNHFIVDRLVDGAADCLIRHGAEAQAIDLIRVPGAWEIPLVAQRIARARQHAGLVAVGAVIRGSTPHFDYVAGEVTKGLASVSLETGMPIGFGVLTVDSIEQAIERAGTKAGNKGWEAAASVLEVVSLGAALAGAGL